MAEKKKYNSILISGRKDQTLTYSKYVKDEESGESVKESLDKKVNVTDELTTKQIKNGAITNEKMAADSVGNSNIQDGSVSNEKLEDGSITNSKLGDNSVDGRKLSNSSVENRHLGNNAVSTSKIASRSVTNEKIANNSVSMAELTPDVRSYIDNKADAEQVNNSLYDLEKKIGERFVVEGDVTNLPDEEDLTSVKESEHDVLKLADRSYAPYNFSGKGYKILRKNIKQVSLAVTTIVVSAVPTSDGYMSFVINGVESHVDVVASSDTTTDKVAGKIAEKLTETMTEYEVSKDASTITITRKFGGEISTPSSFSAVNTGVSCTITDSTKKELRNILTPIMMNQHNTIYVIRYDFDLNGETIKMQKGCTLKFEGGSLVNGVLKGNNTNLSGIPNLKCSFDGIFLTNEKEINVKWFGAIGDGTTLDTESLKRAILFCKCLTEKRNAIQGNKQCRAIIAFPSGTYLLDATLIIPDDISINGYGSSIIPSPNGKYHNDYMIYFGYNDFDTVSQSYGEGARTFIKDLTIFAYEYYKSHNKNIRGIKYSSQGKITNINSLFVNYLLDVNDSYKDYVEIDKVYAQDVEHDAVSIHTGYLGDMRKITNSTFSGIVELGKTHTSLIVDNCIFGKIVVDSTDVHFSNCMFNADSGIAELIGANVLFTNCFFSYNGKLTKLKINESYRYFTYRATNVTFISCRIAFFRREDFGNEEDNPIFTIQGEPNIRFIDTSFVDLTSTSMSGSYNVFPYIKGYNFFNNYGKLVNDGLITKINKEFSIKPKIKLLGISRITDSHIYNITDFIGDVYYRVISIFDFERGLRGNIGNEIKGIFSEQYSPLIVFNQTFNECNFPSIRIYKGTESGKYTEYVDMPFPYDAVVGDDGIHCGCRKWNTCSEDHFNEFVNNYTPSDISEIKYFNIDSKTGEHNVCIKCNGAMLSNFKKLKDGDIVQNNNTIYLYNNNTFFTTDGINGLISRMDNTVSRPNPEDVYDGFMYCDTTLHNLLCKYWKGSYYDIYGYTPALTRGDTSSRPTNLLATDEGFLYYDTSLKKSIRWDGASWIDSNGNPADAKKQGISTERPSNVQIGYIYKDTTLNKLIIWDGAAWVNLDGTQLS